MAGLSQRETARLAGCSQMAVWRALQVGYLVAGTGGRIDPEHPANSRWIGGHQRGIDTLGRLYAPPASSADVPIDLDNLDAEFERLMAEFAKGR